jgi:hypothetical protein
VRFESADGIFMGQQMDDFFHGSAANTTLSKKFKVPSQVSILRVSIYSKIKPSQQTEDGF